MIVVDVNVLVALARRDHPDHELAGAWWRSRAESGETVTVPDLVWVGVVRVLTHSRVFAAPSSLEEAFGFMASVRAQPTYVAMLAGADLIDDFASLAVEAQAAGNLATDAYIGAAARRFGARVATFDRDFRRFRGLALDEVG